jgi:hypothetical protein
MSVDKCYQVLSSVIKLTTNLPGLPYGYWQITDISLLQPAGAQCVLEVIPVNKGSLTKTVRTYTKSFKTSPLDGAGWYN